MAGIFALASLRGRRNACQPEDDAEHDGFGGGTAHHAAPAHLVPDLAVMVAAPFEKAGLAVGSVPDVNRGQDALELAEDAAVQVDQARVLRRQEDGDAERLANLFERRLFGPPQKNAAGFPPTPSGA